MAQISDTFEYQFTFLGAMCDELTSKVTQSLVYLLSGDAHRDRDNMEVKCPLLTPTTCWQMVFTTPRYVTGSALAPPCAHLSQCCFLCHKTCRVPFLTCLRCLLQSCTLSIQT